MTRGVWVLALGVLALYGAVATRIPARGFVTVDTGAIYLQAVRLATAGTADIPVGPLLEPVAQEFYPWRLASTPAGPITSWDELQSGWFVVQERRATIIYPIGFGWLAALVYRVFGESAMVWISVLAGALAVLSTGLLAARLGVGQPVAAAAVAAASPLALYATLVWGHAPAVAAAAVGFLMLEADRALAAGLAFGIAGAFRNEGLLLSAVVCAVLALAGPRRWRAFVLALGVGIALAPGLAYNRAHFGSVLDRTQAARTGMYLGHRPPREPFSERLKVKARDTAATLWESAVQSENLKGAPQAVLGGVVLFGLALVLAHPWGTARAGLRVLAIAGVLYAWFAWLIKPQLVPGLLLCAPALGLGVVALLSPRLWWDDARVAAVSVVVFLGGCAYRGSPGWQWGARYMLLALPVLAVLGVRLAERIGAMAQVKILTAVGAAMMVIAWRDLASEQAFREEEQRWVRSVDARVVAFDHWWFSWENPRLALDGELFFVSDAQWLAKFLEYARSRDVRRVAFVTRVADPGAFERAAAGWTVTRYSAPLPYGHVWNGLLLERP